MPSPIIPYAGFKGWQADFVRSLVGRFNGQPFNVCDPFLGGGGYLQAVAGSKNLRDYVAGDMLEPLVRLWRRGLRFEADGLQEELRSLMSQYPLEALDESYYAVRERAPDNEVAFLYVLLWGFNGLYRTNLSGECNVPIGKGPRWKRPDDAIARVFDRLATLRRALDRIDTDVEVLHQPWPFTLERAAARGGRLLGLFDPPYVGGFTSYAGRWDETDLGQLIEMVQIVAQAVPGVYLICGHEGAVEEMLSDRWEIHKLTRSSSISSDASTRGEVVEVAAVLDTLGAAA